MSEIRELDVIGADAYAEQGYPHAAWRRLRREAPIAWFDLPERPGFWAVTRHADIVSISKQPKRFRNAPRLAVFPEGPPPEEQNQLARGLLHMDPPGHARFRRVANPEYRKPGETVQETGNRTRQELFAYFVDLADKRRADPRDDMVSVLANGKVNGEPLPTLVLLSYCLLLVVAGNETTRNAASGGLLALIENPDQLEKLRRDPELVTPAVEEIVRWTAPVIQFCRTPTEDVELHGQKVKAGESLCLFYPSACRDEEIFDEPDRSASIAIPTRTSASGSASTSVWAPTWRAWSSVSSSACWPSACATWSSPGRSSACVRASSAA